MPAPTARGPHRSPVQLDYDIAGTRMNAAGRLNWGADVDARGRTLLTISADAISGDLIVATLTFPSHVNVAAHLPGVLNHFERVTLANWDHPTGTIQSVRLIRGWYLTIGWGPFRLPLIRRTRLTAGRSLRNGWTRYEIVSVPPNATPTPDPKD